MSQYSRLSKHDHYHSMMSELREGGDGFLVITRLRGAWATVYRCYVFASQEDALDDAARQVAAPLLECRVSRRRGCGAMMLRGDTRLGVVVAKRPGAQPGFQVNGCDVLGMTIATTFRGKDIDTYAVRLAATVEAPPPLLHMRRPVLRASDMTYRLRYRRIQTKRCGIESVKNFCLDRSTGGATAASDATFECLKSSRHNILAYFSAPLDSVLAAALVILRFER